MIGLDTNVLVRYLVHDDPIQARKARRLIENELSEANPGFVTVVALVETAWVLDRAYGFGPKEIANAIERTLQADTLIVEDEQEAFTAMVALKEGRAAFADALIATLGARAGCSRTVTFDERAARLPEFTLL